MKKAERLEPRFTPRQAEVVDLIARGHRTRDIATRLEISERAVTKHLTAAMAKAGVENRTALIGVLLSERVSADLARTPSRRRVRTARTALDEAERYRDAPFLVAVTRGPRHVFAYVNTMWQRVMKLRDEDVLGKPFDAVFPRPSPTTFAARQEAFRRGRPTSGNAWHYRWTQSDGTEREADFNYIYQPLRGRTGRVEGLALIATEVEQKR